MTKKSRVRTVLVSFCIVLFLTFLSSTPLLTAEQAPSSLELSRPARPWEFLPVLGTRAGLLGNEAGQMEGWVYPLKIFRGLHLTFHLDGRALPAESLVRTLVVHPESATLVYAGDNFSIKETLFVPVHEQGAVIVFDIETSEPLEIEAGFFPDFQLEWPAALGGGFVSWESTLHAFEFGEEGRKFSALFGSPTATYANLAYESNYSNSEEDSLRLGVTRKGRDRKVMVLAASTKGFPEAADTYQRLATSTDKLLAESAQYYRDYLNRTVSLSLPDRRLQDAYDWSRVSMLQGVVNNPFLGTGLVAGYRTSGFSQRPGFAWFFGRDSFWTSFALNSIGDFATTRQAIEFVSKFQREDGRIPHEISQGASFVDWFKAFPFPYASADATPLYILAANDYIVESHDLEFARQKWDSLWKAYQFLTSTYDEHKFPKNIGVGHGWVEGGPLLPVKSEFYQSGLGVAALQALANIARLIGKDDVSKNLSGAFDQQRPLLNQAFWSADNKSYEFALDLQNKIVNEASVLTTVPMWFGLTDVDKSELTIQQLAEADQQTDWGMRIISNRSAVYNGAGYHFGSVWPLFTGWASVGEYRYHQALPAYLNLRANALLALDGSLGHVAEVLSGDYYQPLSTNSPHQIWSAAMVVSPIVRGMLGLNHDSFANKLSFAPHLPANWGKVGIGNVRCGTGGVTLTYRRAVGSIGLDIGSTSGTTCTIEFSPSISLHAGVISVALDGRKTPFREIPSGTDRHVTMTLPVTGGNSTLQIKLRNDFDVIATSELPALGSASEGLRVLAETWNSGHTELTLALSGVGGKTYSLALWNPSQVSSVRGGKLSERGNLTVQFPSADSNAYTHQQVVLSFRGSK